MLFLAEFSPLIPEFGILFWTTLLFVVVWFFLGKTAFGPIANALTKRENSIQESLDAAKRAKEEMDNSVAEKERILAQAMSEKMQILNEAKEAKEQILKEARQKAKEESSRIIAAAQDEAVNTKSQAMAEVKNAAGSMAVKIAESLLKREVGSNQKDLVAGLIDEIKL